MDTGENWEAVKRNIRIVGITPRAQTGAATWRWQQQPDNDWWTTVLQRQAIKNVSISKQMWYYLGEEQPKVILTRYRGVVECGKAGLEKGDHDAKTTTKFYG